MARIRIGPLSYGPKGRRGIHAGPFSASYNTRSPAFGAFMLLVVIVAIVKSAPYLLLIVLVPLLVWFGTKRKREEQEATVQQRRAEQAVATQQRRVEQEAVEVQAQAVAQRKWLEGSPPTLYVPRRFSEGWFADNVPQLHPGQVPALIDELRARGWTDQRIQQRLARYLVMNPFWMAEATGGTVGDNTRP